MYEIVSFICGMAVMVLELVGLNATGSYFPTAQEIVSTSIIGVIMVALSIGYWIGGRLSNKNPSGYKLSFIVFLSAVYMLILVFTQPYFVKLIMLFNISYAAQTMLFSLVIFTVPSILLGIVSPYIIQVALNEQKKKEIAGQIAGRFYAISTIGSIIGTFMCGFWLVNIFSNKAIFILVCFSLIIASFLSICACIKYRHYVRVEEYEEK